MARIWRGEFSDGVTLNGTRVSGMFKMLGQQQNKVSKATSGQVVALGRMDNIKAGDVLSASGSADGPDWPAPLKSVYALSIHADKRDDEVKLAGALAKVVEEDESLSYGHNSDTGEMVLTGLGEAQIDVTVDKIKRKFGAELLTRLPRVPYRETITRTAQSEYRHKKQSGGHGQYGHVMLRVEPMQRDEGFAFGSEIVGGKVPREYIPSVEKGVVKTMEEGVVAGYPVVDVKAVIYDGSYHDVDSSGMAFEIAGSQALKSGMLDASPILLEPIVKLTINACLLYTSDLSLIHI